MHRQRMTCDLCMMHTVASTERLTAAMQSLQGLGSSACTSARPRSALVCSACDRHRNKAAPAQKLQRNRTFKEHCEIREVARSFLRRARVRMPMPCCWRLSTGSDPKIRSALHSQKRHPKVQKRHPKVPYSVSMCEPRPAAQEASRCGIPPAMWLPFPV